MRLSQWNFAKFERIFFDENISEDNYFDFVFFPGIIRSPTCETFLMETIKAFYFIADPQKEFSVTNWELLNFLLEKAVSILTELWNT